VASGVGPGSQTSVYARDVADRLTQIASPHAAVTLEYDAANQVVRSRDTGTGQVRSAFSFDAVGNRTAHKSGRPDA
jgi:YD repeat-containing protein